MAAAAVDEVVAVSTVWVLRDPATRTARVRFPYDPALVELIKAVVNPASRSWDKPTKSWIVDSLAVGDFLLHARRLGHVIEDGRGTPPPPRQAPPRGADWAVELFAAVGPARAESVFRALTRVLHPDVATGDTVLMQDLNNARREIAS